MGGVKMTNQNENFQEDEGDDQDDLPPITSLERDNVIIFNDGLPGTRPGRRIQ